MTIDRTSILQSITQTLGPPWNRVSFRFDAIHWGDEEVTNFVEAAQAITSDKTLRLKGVALGGDISKRLGNPQKIHGVPIAQTEDVGSVELVFEG